MVQAKVSFKDTKNKLVLSIFNLFPVSFSSRMSCLAQTEKCMEAASEIGLQPLVPLLLA